MGDRALLIEMAELWLADSAKQVRDIQNGLELGNATTVQRAAHALKGSVGTFRLCRSGCRETIGTVREDGDLIGSQNGV